MSLRKVTFFDHQGPAVAEVDEDGQAKPCVLGVRWVNPDTIETIGVRGGKRTGPKSEVLRQIKPALNRAPMHIEGLDKRPSEAS